MLDGLPDGWGNLDEAVIDTKSAFTLDVATRNILSRVEISSDYIRSACEASLRCL